MEHPIQPLTNNTASNVESFAAYNNDSRRAVFAEEMIRGTGNTEYDIFGFQGTKDIVCLDCKSSLGKEVPLQLVAGKKTRKHFRHPQGLSPVGKGRHGETSDHFYGKYLVVQWLKDQLSVVPGTVSEEYWMSESQLRMDVTAELLDGTRMAFEVQRWQLNDEDWERRHGKYERDGVKDVWLWAPHVTSPRMTEIPTGNLVLDVQTKTLGLHVAPRAPKKFGKLEELDPDFFMHPSRLFFQPKATHYASAPLNDWVLEPDGSLTPPESLLRHLAGEATEKHGPIAITQQEPLTWNQVGVWHRPPRIKKTDNESKIRKPKTKEDYLAAKQGNYASAYDYWLYNTPRGNQELIDREIRIKDLQAKWQR